MSTDRDTHFQGFARLLVDEMERNMLILVHPKAVPIIKEEMTKIIARRAYDLAVYVLDQMSEGSESLSPEENLTIVPDLTEWPVERDE